MTTLDELRYRNLPEQETNDGCRWTPRVPREFVIRGTAIVVRVIGLTTGAAGTSYARVEAQIAHQCLVCPGSVRLDELEERAPYGCGPIPPEQLVKLPGPLAAPATPEEDEEAPSRLSAPQRARLSALWEREPQLSASERCERDALEARMRGC